MTMALGITDEKYSSSCTPSSAVNEPPLRPKDVIFRSLFFSHNRTTEKRLNLQRSTLYRSPLPSFLCRHLEVIRRRASKPIMLDIPHLSLKIRLRRDLIKSVIFPPKRHIHSLPIPARLLSNPLPSTRAAGIEHPFLGPQDNKNKGVAQENCRSRGFENIPIGSSKIRYGSGRIMYGERPRNTPVKPDIDPLVSRRHTASSPGLRAGSLQEPPR